MIPAYHLVVPPSFCLWVKPRGRVFFFSPFPGIPYRAPIEQCASPRKIWALSLKGGEESLLGKNRWRGDTTHGEAGNNGSLCEVCQHPCFSFLSSFTRAETRNTQDGLRRRERQRAEHREKSNVPSRTTDTTKVGTHPARRRQRQAPAPKTSQDPREPRIDHRDDTPE